MSFGALFAVESLKRGATRCAIQRRLVRAITVCIEREDAEKILWKKANARVFINMYEKT